MSSKRVTFLKVRAGVALLCPRQDVLLLPRCMATMGSSTPPAAVRAGVATCPRQDTRLCRLVAWQRWAAAPRRTSACSCSAGALRARSSGVWAAGWASWCARWSVHGPLRPGVHSPDAVVDPRADRCLAVLLLRPVLALLLRSFHQHRSPDACVAFAAANVAKYGHSLPDKLPEAS